MSVATSGLERCECLARHDLAVGVSEPGVRGAVAAHGHAPELGRRRRVLVQHDRTPKKEPRAQCRVDGRCIGSIMGSVSRLSSINASCVSLGVCAGRHLAQACALPAASAPRVRTTGGRAASARRACAITILAHLWIVTRVLRAVYS